MTRHDCRPDERASRVRPRQARGSRFVAVGLTCALLLAGCTDADGQDTDVSDSGQDIAAGVDSAGESDTGTAASGATDNPGEVGDEGPDAGDGTAPGGPAPASPTPAEQPSTPRPVASPTSQAVEDPSPEPIPLAGEVEPTCVRQGGVMRLTVRTEPGLPVIYSAVYDGEEGGGPPPYGAGHGGNDGGNADEDGVYRSEWTVSPDAPVGAARVEVVTARQDGSGQTAQTSIPFEVRPAVSAGC